MRPCVCRRLAAVLLCVLASAAPVVAQSFDPALRFRTTRTPHFAIHFQEGAEALAARLAGIAEETWQVFANRPGGYVPGMTHVVLTDQSELANGFATPLPRNVIVLFAAAPSPSDLLNADDWLRTLFVHEFTHIVHLDRSEGWANLAQAVFGRAPWTFPNLTLPLWHIEGLATWEESRSTAPGVGRLHAGDFLAITRQAARAGELPPIDRIGGGVTDWPGGLAPYAYGASFHAWIAARHGPDSLAALSSATARRLPWLNTRAFGQVFGRSASDLWREYAAEITAGGADARVAAGPPARRLTTDGFVATGPRWLPQRCDGCPRELLYTRRTPHDRPGLHIVAVDAEGARDLRLRTRFTGRTTTHRDGRAYFDAGELARNSGPYSDLYVLTLDTGDVKRLTKGARLLDPDLSPDGDRLVATQHMVPGRRDLVIVSLPSDETSSRRAVATPLVVAHGTQFDAPRWAPDGRTIVATRQPPAGPAELVLVDVASGRVDVLAAGDDMRWATPTWRPDGRAIVAAAARGDGPYELYEIPVDDRIARRLVGHPGGALWPDVSDDGESIVYVGYALDGFDLYLVPYPTTAAQSAADVAGSRATESPPAPTEPTLRSSPYSPWSTLRPTFWSPIVTTDDDTRVGAAISGSDVLGYHTWTASVTWPIRSSDVRRVVGQTADWNASYVYGRWRLQPWVTSGQSTSLFTADDADVPATDRPLAIAEETTEAGVRLAVRHLAASHTFQASFARTLDTVARRDGEAERNRSGLRAAWRFSSAQHPGYGISPERGVSAGAAAELIRPALGAAGRSSTLTIDGRAYLPGVRPHHVMAVRVMRGVTWGDDRVRRLFLLGGGDASRGPGSLSSEAGRLLRGFATNTFAGRHVATMNVDYRFPLVRPQRGLGAWPFLLHSLHGAIVADVGDAWNQDFAWQRIKASYGVELAADLVVGYRLPITIAAGVARGHDRSGRVSPRTTGYVRVGHAF